MRSSTNERMIVLLQMELEPRQPYSFEHTVRRLIGYKMSGYTLKDGILYRTLRIEGRPLLLAVSLKEKGKPVLLLQVQGAESVDPDKIEEMFRQLFLLDQDLTPFYQTATNDPYLAQIVQERRGLRPVLDPSLYECLIRTIIGQQIHQSFAATLVHRLTSYAGDTMIYGGGEHFLVFPEPEQVAQLDYNDLQQMQFNRRKAEYIIDLSRQIVEGRLNLEQLSKLDDEAVMKKLMTLRGVGRWTAECLLLFGLGRKDLLPAADIGLRNAIRNIYRLDQQPSEEEVRRIGQRWAPWRSYATFYLWDSLT